MEKIRKSNYSGPKMALIMQHLLQTNTGKFWWKKSITSAWCRWSTKWIKRNRDNIYRTESKSSFTKFLNETLTMKGAAVMLGIIVSLLLTYSVESHVVCKYWKYQVDEMKFILTECVKWNEHVLFTGHGCHIPTWRKFPLECTLLRCCKSKFATQKSIK